MLVAQTELAGPDFGDEAALDGEIVGVGAGEGAGVGAGAGGVAEVVAPTLSPARRFRYEFARLGGVGLGGGPSSSSFVDLGLVYGLNVEQVDSGTAAVIDMTLTSAACPLTDVIEDQTRGALVGAGLVNDIRINWVWNPPWGPDKITDDGREQLRALGFTV